MKNCKYCGTEISKKAKICPKCGGKFGMPTLLKVLIIIFIIFCFIIGCTGGCASLLSDSISEVQNSYNDINGKTSFNLNETFENKYEKITMIEVNTNFIDYEKYLGPKDGNKIIMAKFEIENINKENDELYVSTLNFHASYDGIVADSYIWASSKYKDFSSTIGKGKKSIGYVFYEVSKDAKSIEIEYNADFWTDGNIIKFIVQ